MNIKQDVIIVRQEHIQMKEIQNVHYVQMVHILLIHIQLYALIVLRVFIQMNIKQIVIIVLLVHIQIVEI